MSSILRTQARARGEWKRAKTETDAGTAIPVWAAQRSTRPDSKRGPAQRQPLVDIRRWARAKAAAHAAVEGQRRVRAELAAAEQRHNGFMGKVRRAWERLTRKGAARAR